MFDAFDAFDAFDDAESGVTPMLGADQRSSPPDGLGTFTMGGFCSPERRAANGGDRRRVAFRYT